ncbi:MAG TPA: hypothetical protein PKD37_05310 [Oligoflexia bacterium]|nr:hypothetical protein [Oligoflexia bacterium]HMP27385.1 hypothetical protein [Oligoflexia bacterium]
MKNRESKFQCSVYMKEEGVNVYSESNRIIHLLEGDFAPFIPEWRVEKKAGNQLPRLDCCFDKKQEIKIGENDSFFISGAFEEFLESHTIPYFIHYILEGQRSKKGKTTIHAAAVSKNGKGVLILGKQGSGKTSITLELCRKYGYSLIGNDLVLISSQNNIGYLYGGTKVFRIRATTIKYYNKDLEKFFLPSSNDEWTRIAIVRPQEIQVITEKSVVPIQAVYYVHLYPSEYRFIVKEVERLFSRVYLYQIFSEYIRGSAIIPLIGKDLRFGDYIPSFDTREAFAKRIKLIDWIIDNKNYKYIAGELVDICNFITSNL